MTEKTIIRSDKVFDSEKMYNYPQAIKVGDTVFVSGQIAIDRQGNLVGRGDIEAQATQAMENLKTVLEAAGARLTDVVKANTYVRNLEDARIVAEVRRRYFKDHKYCHTSCVVASLALKNLLVEIDAIAVI